ncbi:hypothetical protein BGW42_003748 [Actinomortierella wolfii]|nr:hypothetical protein BGW42_003748 [Actinomortierella wolfii]
MSSDVSNKKPKVQGDEKIMCQLCMAEFKTARSLSNHKSESHDGGQERVAPLKCPFCSKIQVQARKTLKEHVLKCPGAMEASYPRICSFCSKGRKEPVNIASIAELASHSYLCHNWPVVRIQQEERKKKLRMELLNFTKHRTTADFVMQMFKPVAVTFSGGSELFGFIMDRQGVLKDDGKVGLVSALECTKVEDVDEVELAFALKPFKLGKLVNVEEYELAGDNDGIWYLPFSKHSGYLSRKLQSCLIQSGHDVLLCLKVEVYGRSSVEDPHADYDVAFPDVKPFKIVNQTFEETTSQLMIGSVSWNALVTMAVVLTSGKIVVGPHNPVFHPHRNSRLWIKKGAEIDLSNNVVRQTRTNFDNEITFGKHAAVHPRFITFKAKPVTLADLWFFKSQTNGWTGVKLAAYVFFNLYAEKGEVLKSEVAERLQMIRRDKNDDNGIVDSDRGILSNLKRLVDLMEEKECRPVSAKVERELRGLAENARKEIANINKRIVEVQVQRILDCMLDSEIEGS